jgi:N-acetylglucosaminyl-diphospho-decaprenol L-rhamnosyltransferase
VTTAVVTLAHGRHGHLTAQRESLLLGTRLPDLYVVVSIEDSWIDGWSPPGRLTPELVGLPRHRLGLPLAAARNAGFNHAVALGAEVLIGLDVDCLAGRELVEGYAEAVRDAPATVWSGPVTYLAPAGERGYDLRELDGLDNPHPARPAPTRDQRSTGADPDLFWSLSFAVHRDAWLRTGGFHEEYVGYGAEDTDFGHQVRVADLGLGWTGSARAYHQHHPSETPPVQHLGDILRNGAIFHRRWGSWPMRGWLEDFEARGLVLRSGEGWVAAPQAGTASG